MKIATLILTLSTLVSLSSSAQDFHLNGKGPGVFNCDYTKMYAPSAKLAEITKSKNPVAHCTGEEQTLEIAFLGVQFKTDSEGFAKKPSIELRCTDEDVAGLYLFGGFPVGFQTKSSSRAPWFYQAIVKQGDNGRCSLEYNRDAITGIEAEQNESMMILLPVAAK